MGQATAGRDALIQALVIRGSRDETTFAFVTVRRTPDVHTARQLLQRFAEAVTAWVRNTKEGREAYEQCSQDYNVGDLANDIGQHSLCPYLKAQGLLDVKIDVYSDDDFQDNWTYDTRLVNAESLDP